MDFIEGLQIGQIQFNLIDFLLCHDELTTPNRSVTTQILLNTEQYFDSSTQRLTEIYQTLNLPLPVTEGNFIGFAVPPNDTVFSARPSTCHQHQIELRHTFTICQQPSVNLRDEY